MAMWRLGPLLVSSCLTLAACGDSSPTRATPPPSRGETPSGGQAITIRGGESLAWDQRADSVTAVRALKFILWVDGAPAQLVNPGCKDVRTAVGYECSGRLPSMSVGRHALELSAMSGGIESTRSVSLVVMMASSSFAPEAATTGSSPDQGQ